MVIHKTSYRLTFRDVDSMGILYYARYFFLFEIGRVEWMRDEGFSYRDMEKKMQQSLPVTKADCHYIAPISYDEIAIVRTEIAAWTQTTIRFSHTIHREEQDELCAKGQVELGCLAHGDQRPSAIPQELITILNNQAREKRGRLR